MGVDPAILRQFISEAGLKHDQTSVSYVFTCPRCQGKKKLYLRKRDGRFVCWVCKETDNYQGRPEFALADLLGAPLKVVRSKLYGGTDVPVDLYLDARLVDFFDEGEADEQLVDAEIPVIEWPLEYYPIDDGASAKGAKYLREERGVPTWIASQYGIRYSPLKRRVAFPVSNHGDLYGYQERLVVPNKWVDDQGVEREMPKILSSTGIPRERTLMFADRLAGSEHAVLAEGPLDAIKAHYCGGNVCAMGKAVGPEQFQLLLCAGVKKVYLALDPDAAGEVQRLVREHYDDVELYEMTAPSRGAKEKADLGAMDFADVLDLFLGAERVGPGRIFFFLSDSVARRA